MKSSDDNPPPIKTTFASREEEIGYLVENVVFWLWAPNKQRAVEFAEQLAVLLGEPNHMGAERFSEEWAAVFDARGDAEQAIRFADVTIQKLRADLDEFGAANYKDTEWYREDAKDLLDALYLQSLRYLRIGRRQAAKERMNDASETSLRFGLQLDEDQLALIDELAE
jgi:hypothetical protein